MLYNEVEKKERNNAIKKEKRKKESKKKTERKYLMERVSQPRYTGRKIKINK